MCSESLDYVRMCHFLDRENVPYKIRECVGSRSPSWIRFACCTGLEVLQTTAVISVVVLKPLNVTRVIQGAWGMAEEMIPGSFA